MTPLILALALADPCPAIAIKQYAMPHVSQPAFYAWLEPWPMDRPVTFRWSVTKGAVLTDDILPDVAPRDTLVRLDLDGLSRHDVRFDLTVEVEGLPANCPHRVTQRFTEPRYTGPPLVRGEGGAICPKVEIAWYASEHLTGEYFVARIDPMPRTPVTYRWTVTGAKLGDGPNSRYASVETDLGELFEHDVTFEIALDVGGLPKGCPHTSSQKATQPRFDRMPPKSN